MYNYNIHDIVKVSSEVSLYELEFFACSSYSGSPDMVIKVSDSIFPKHIFKRRMSEEESSEGSVKIKYTEQTGKFGAQFEIEFIKKRANVTVNKLISNSRHVLYVNLVEPILRFLIVSRGFVLLHSACISDNAGKNGILLSAPPDTGKTTTVLKCLKGGYSFLSDDMTILSLPNKALCFPKPMTISAHTFKTATTVANKEGDHSKGGLKIRSLIHSKAGRQFMRRLGTKNVPIFTINTIGQSIVKPPKFKVEDLLQEINLKHQTEITEMLFLERGGEVIERISTDDALKKSVENSDDAFIFPPYKQILQYLRIDGKSANDLLANERSMIQKFLINLQGCQLIKSEKRAWFQKVTEILPVSPSTY